MNKQYSSFSQTKGLLWKDWFDGILKNKFLPPVGAVIDLTDQCNLGCHWCNAQHFRSKNMLDYDHVLKVVDMIADWGVKSVCYAGGGEPTLHPKFSEIVRYSANQGLEVGISTNGTNLNTNIINAVVYNARFCGVSFDAGIPPTWQRLKRSKRWDKLISDAEQICKKAKTVALDTTYKFMVVPENQYEILTACTLAKKLGFKNFFVRPVAYENVPDLEQQKWQFDPEAIYEQMKKCLTLETDTFKVYGSFGRVKKDLSKVCRFRRCRASPLIAVFCADGYSYLCIDTREQPHMRLCKHLDLRDYWGSKKHKQMIENVDLDQCPRCAFGHYQEQLEAYEADYMYWKFP